MTIDELLFFAFNLKCTPLLRLIQNDKIKKIHDPIDGKVMYIELYFDTFKDMSFDDFIHDMLNYPFGTSIKVIDKKLLLFIKYNSPK